MTESLEDHKIVSEKEWIKARKSLLKKEKEFTVMRDQLNQQRRKLPWKAVNKEYFFEGPNGRETLEQLFDGRSQLIVYHFMFDRSWDAGCLHCSFWADNFNEIIVHLNQRDVTMISVSRARIASWLLTNSGWAGISSGYLLMIQISISIMTCHSHRKSCLRKKASITIICKIRSVQSGRESAYFTKILQITCFIPTQLMHVVSICSIWRITTST
jgi:hypothetical protein